MARDNRAGIRWLSGARLDATTIGVPVERAQLRRVLAVHPDLSLSDGASSGRGKHLLLIDLFRVKLGRVQMGAADQHEVSAIAGGSWGACVGAGVGGTLGIVQGAAAGATMASYVGEWLGPAGVLFGTAAGLLGGATLGGLAGLAPGMSLGARAGATALGRASRRLSETIGTYDEVLIGVPDVVVRSETERRHVFVVGMYTNSPIARWGDRTFGFGYGKQPAAIANDPFRSFEVTAAGRRLLSVDFTTPVAADWTAPDPQPDDVFSRAFQQPLLGVTERGQLARSWLARDYADPTVRIASRGGATVRMASRFAPGLSERTHRVRRDAGAVLHTRSVMSRVSYPVVVGGAAGRNRAST